MTHSVARRRRDVESVLRLMVTDVGDEAIRTAHFSPHDQHRFSNILLTTFDELLDQGDLETTGEKPGPIYRLTPEGWLHGLELLGQLDGQHVRERIIVIIAALKARAKGRQGAVSIDVRDLAVELGIPVGWLSNAMAAELPTRLFPNAGFSATSTDGLLIQVPATFGRSSGEA